MAFSRSTGIPAHEPLEQHDDDAARPRSMQDGVVEPDPRVVMAVLVVGIIVGALFTPSSVKPTPTTAAADTAIVQPAPAPQPVSEAKH